MFVERGESRSLMAWLMSQEKIVRLWIAEAAATAEYETEFIVKLEQHRIWLAERIKELSLQEAA